MPRNCHFGAGLPPVGQLASGGESLEKWGDPPPPGRYLESLTQNGSSSSKTQAESFSHHLMPGVDLGPSICWADVLPLSTWLDTIHYACHYYNSQKPTFSLLLKNKILGFPQQTIPLLPLQLAELGGLGKVFPPSLYRPPNLKVNTRRYWSQEWEKEPYLKSKHYTRYCVFNNTANSYPHQWRTHFVLWPWLFPAEKGGLSRWE